jgi:hypothetical protein
VVAFMAWARVTAARRIAAASSRKASSYPTVSVLFMSRISITYEHRVKQKEIYLHKVRRYLLS